MPPCTLLAILRNYWNDVAKNVPHPICVLVRVFYPNQILLDVYLYSLFPKECDCNCFKLSNQESEPSESVQMCMTIISIYFHQGY